MKKATKNAVNDLRYAFVAVWLSGMRRHHLAARWDIGHPQRSRFAGLVALSLAVMVVYLIAAGWLYPLRPDTITAIGHPFTKDPALIHAWGGPTLIGAWLAHATIAIGIQTVCMVVIRRLHGRRTDAVVR